MQFYISIFHSSRIDQVGFFLETIFLFVLEAEIVARVNSKAEAESEAAKAKEKAEDQKQYNLEHWQTEDGHAGK